jgi:hypothetical protein
MKLLLTIQIETKVVNSILIVAGVLCGAAAGWWVLSSRARDTALIVHRILFVLVRRQLQVLPKARGLAATEAPDEDASLLRNSSSESLHENV